MHTLWQDIQFAVRTLRKAPAFSLLAIVTLALGIGATTAVFSMVNGVLLRRLPYGADDRLVALHQPTARLPDAGFSYLELADYRSQVPELSALAEYHSMSFDLYGRGEPLRVLTGVVSDNFFKVVDVKPLYGRLFAPGEDAVGAPPVVLLSYAFWMDKMGGDPKVVGTTFTMNDKVHTIIGVLPPLPPYPNANDIWMPAGACPFRSAPQVRAARQARGLGAFGVLKPGATLTQASASMAVVASRLHSEYASVYPDAGKFTSRVARLHDELTATSRPLFTMLMIIAFFVLAVATANFASLTLSRQLRRGREMALRSALGASRARLFRQLATESLCITITGGLLGVVIAYGGLGVLRTLAARVTPRAGDITIDMWVLAFALVLSVAVGIVAALVPLRRTDTKLAETLRAAANATSGGRDDGRLRGALVATQVAVAFVILIAAGLLTRSLLELESIDGGYKVDHVLTARIALNWSRYTTPETQTNFIQELQTRLEADPGSKVVAIATDFPLNNATSTSRPFLIHGQPVDANQTGPVSDATVISPQYFQAIGIPLMRGRAFTSADRDTGNVPAIISQQLAKTYWRDAEPLGSQLSVDNGVHWSTVVGVVADVRQNNLDAAPTSEIYLPIAAFPVSNLRVLIRTDVNPASKAKTIRQAVASIDPNQPVYGVQTLEDLRGASLAQPRETAVLVLSFGLLALIITAGGLAGVVGYSVSQRTTEIGIRVALGATKQSVLKIVMAGGIGVALIGEAIGLAVSLGLSGFLHGLLYGVAPTDAATFTAIALLLLLVATLACLLPARRALRISPVEALRAR